MAKEFFKALPDTSTPLSPERLNGLLNGNEAMGSIAVEDLTCNGNLLSTLFGDWGNFFKQNGVTSKSWLELEKPGVYTYGGVAMGDCNLPTTAANYGWLLLFFRYENQGADTPYKFAIYVESTLTSNAIYIATYWNGTMHGWKKIALTS